MHEYPSVLGELETLRLVAAGRSLARFGDGELNLCAGERAKRQQADPQLAARLRAILTEAGDCLVGIPNLRSATPKARFWQRYTTATAFLTDRPYVSAFVTRPDSAPWLDTPEYWGLLESLWIGQDVVLIRGGRHGLTAADLQGARRVTEISAPPANAWAAYDAMLSDVGTGRRVLLCLGPTATVLAADLCARGVQAIDLGHVGLFLRKHRRGEPLIVTAEDKAA